MPNSILPLLQLPLDDYKTYVKTRMSYEEIRALASIEFDDVPPADYQQYIDIARSEALQKLLEWCTNNHVGRIQHITKLKQDCVDQPWESQEKIIKYTISKSDILLRPILIDFLAQIGDPAFRPLLQNGFLVYIDTLRHFKDLQYIVLSGRTGHSLPQITTMASTANSTFSIFASSITLSDITSSIGQLCLGEIDRISSHMEFSLSSMNSRQLQNSEFITNTRNLLIACQSPKGIGQEELAEKQIFALLHILGKLGVTHPIYSETALIFCEKAKDSTIPSFQQNFFRIALAHLINDYLRHKKTELADWAITIMKELLVLDATNPNLLQSHRDIILYFLNNSGPEESWFWDLLKEKISNFTYKDINRDETLTFLDENTTAIEQPFFMDIIRSTFKILFDIQRQYARGAIPLEKYAYAPGHILACIANVPKVLYQESWFQEGIFELLESVHAGFIPFHFKFQSSLCKLLERIPLNLLHHKRFLTFIDTIINLMYPTHYPNISSNHLSRYIGVLLALLLRQDVDESIVYAEGEYNRDNIINQIRTHIQAAPENYNSEIICMIASLEQEWIQLALEIKQVPTQSPCAFPPAQKIKLSELAEYSDEEEEDEELIPDTADSTRPSWG